MKNQQRFILSFFILLVGFSLDGFAQTLVQQTTLPPWLNDLSFTGQVAIRMERDVFANYKGSSGENDYAGLLGTFGINDKLNDSMSAHIQTTTGTIQETPVQYFGSGFSSTNKSWAIDRLYLDYKIDEGFVVQGGKMPIPFWSPGGNQMVWNIYQALEGIQLKWDHHFGGFQPFAILNYSSILDRVNNTPVTASVTDGPDLMVLGSQIGLKWKTPNQWASLGVGNFAFNNIKGLPAALTGLPLAYPQWDITQTGNNSTDATNTFYLNDYNEIEVGLEYGYEFGFGPIAVFGDYVQNTVVSADNVGTYAGVRWGRINEIGGWAVQYDYRDVRRDAVLATFADISFLNGGTDLLGSEYTVSYQAWKNVCLMATYQTGKKEAVTLNNGGNSYEVYALTTNAKF